jgi:lipoate-protein ligase A
VDAARPRAWAEAGIRAVRRPTGGGAVLHGEDLTYALAVPAAWLPGGVAGGHQRVGEALLAALRAVGVAAEVAPAGARPARDFDCFAVASADEICVAGRKLVGSAQRRSPVAVLQHGSLRLRPDPPPTVAAAGLAPAASTSLAELGGEADEEVLRAALRRSFAEILRADPMTHCLASHEVEKVSHRAEFLSSEKLHAVRGLEAPEPQEAP